MSMLTEIDKALLQFFQDSFPLEPRPFKIAAGRFGMTESKLLSRLKKLRELGVIRYLGGIFDPKKLGVHSVLCAASVPADKVAAAARLVSGLRGVSHNYLRLARGGDPNLWFTFSARSEAACRFAVEALSRESGLAILQLPAEKVFKIDARFSLAGAKHAARGKNRRVVMRPQDKKLVICLNRPFPLTARPFRGAAYRLGTTEERVVSDIRYFLEAGLMRRFGLILGHTRVGLNANCMAAWRVPRSGAGRAGRIFAQAKEITHCYLRTAAPGWPYNIYTMVHCESRPACLRLLARLSRKTGVKDYKALFTVKEFKKTKADLAAVL